MKSVKYVAATLLLGMTITTLPATGFADEQTDKAVEAYNAKKISRYPVVNEADATGTTKQIFAGAKKGFGFVPNVLKALAHRPAELAAFVSYNKALRTRKTGLTPVEREMLLEAFSAENSCMYCTVYHGAELRVNSQNPFLSDMISTNYKAADITPRQRAIVDFALKLNSDAPSIDKSDFDTLHSFGLSDEDIWDVAAWTALYNYANRMMTFLEVRPDAQFYEMGR